MGDKKLINEGDRLSQAVFKVEGLVGGDILARKLGDTSDRVDLWKEVAEEFPEFGGRILQIKANLNVANRVADYLDENVTKIIYRCFRGMKDLFAKELVTSVLLASSSAGPSGEYIDYPADIAEKFIPIFSSLGIEGLQDEKLLNVTPETIIETILCDKLSLRWEGEDIFAWERAHIQTQSQELEQ